MTDRELKAVMIAATSKLTQKDGAWLVPSQSTGKRYTVNPNPTAPQCNCPDFELRQQKCKHVLAVEITIQREHTETIDGQTVTTKGNNIDDNSSPPSISILLTYVHR